MSGEFSQLGNGQSRLYLRFQVKWACLLLTGQEGMGDVLPTGMTAFPCLVFLHAVDGLDKASIANSDGPAAGSQTPPFKRKGKLSTIGKIFKPWKWRKKKTSDKFRETSAGMNIITLLEEQLLNSSKGKKLRLAGILFWKKIHI